MQPDMTRKVLRGLEQVRRRPPENIIEPEQRLFLSEYEKTFGEIRTEVLEEISVLGNGFLVRNLQTLSPSFAVSPSGLRRAKVAARTVQARLAATRVTEVDRGLFLTDEFSNGFFHWVCDVLPKLELLRVASVEELAARTLVVRDGDFPYVRPSLEPYHLKGLEVLGRCERVRCGNLLVVPPLPNGTMART